MKNKILLFLLLSISLMAKDRSEYQLDIMTGFDVFGNAKKTILNYYIEDVSIDTLIKTAIEGMLSDLDPYSEYFSSGKSNDLNVITNGNFFGFGFSFRIIHNKIVLTRVRDNSPAERVGFKIGDIIVSVDSVVLDSANVDNFFIGIDKEEVNFKVVRIGLKDTLNITATKDTLYINAVTYSDIFDSGNNIGYIKLEQFTVNSYSEFLKAFYDLQRKKMLDGLIIDLRGNSGGVMNEALKICNMFVPFGALLLTTKGKNHSREYNAMLSPVDTSLPIVVLIDDESASASEIVAGCLQDLDRATIIGSTSFGKGLVQEVFPLSVSKFLKLTTAKYYTPSGRCIQRINYLHNSTADNNSINSVEGDNLENDSTRIFYTKNGKEVYELNGIRPDIVVEKDTIRSRLTRMLIDASITHNFISYYVNVMPNNDISETLINNLYDSFVVYATNYENAKYIKTISDLNMIKKTDSNARIVAIINTAIDSVLLEYKNILLEDEQTVYAVKKFLEYDYVMRTLNYGNVIKYSLREDKILKAALENF